MHNELLVTRPAPPIAINAADNQFPVIVDFSERAFAVGAVHSCSKSSPLHGGDICPTLCLLRRSAIRELLPTNEGRAQVEPNTPEVIALSADLGRPADWAEAERLRVYRNHP